MKRIITVKLSKKLEEKLLEECKQQEEFMQGLTDDMRPSDTTWTIEDHLEMLLEKFLEKRYGNRE